MRCWYACYHVSVRLGVKESVIHRGRVGHCGSVCWTDGVRELLTDKHPRTEGSRESRAQSVRIGGFMCKVACCVRMPVLAREPGT